MLTDIVDRRLTTAGQFTVREILDRRSVLARLAAAFAVALTCAGPGVQGQTARAGTGQQPVAPEIYFTPTLHAVADAMLKLARVGPGDIVYDLGSGDGRLVIIAAQKYGARGVGVELDPKLVEVSRQVAVEGEVADRVRFIQGDLYATDISEATVVTLFLSTSANAKLEPKLKSELRPGTRIVSHQFGIAHWAPEQTVRAEDGTDLFLWTVPAR